MTMNPAGSAASAPTSAVPTSPTDEYEKLKRLVAEAEPDYQKAIGGNKAAGTRVRKSMQDIKAQSQAIRVRVLESRSTAP